jgi:hypothetical protein
MLKVSHRHLIISCQILGKMEDYNKMTNYYNVNEGKVEFIWVAFMLFLDGIKLWGTL